MRDDARGETSALLASRDDDAVESMEQARRVSSRSASSTRTSVMCTVAAIAAAAAIGVWTHKSKTLQEAWRPVPGAELVTGGDERSMITRWSKTGKTMASLGQSFTGVTPTPSQLTALKALRLQVRTAMFSPGGISPETLNLLSSRFGAIVPQASSLFPSGKPDTIDQLDSAIKTLLANGTPAAPAAPAAESEFRGMLPSGDRPTIASGEETDAASAVPTSGRSKPPRKPLTQYESALLETKAAANAVASTGAYNHKSKSVSSETQTVRQNDNLERMINSLDPKGGSSSRGSVMSDISSYDVDANDIFSRSPGQAPSGDFVQYSENAPSPRRRRARRSKEAQEEPQTGDADSLPPWAHGAPSNEAASQQLAAAQPAPQPAPVEEDTSWTSFQEQLPGDTPTPSESPSPSPSPTPSPSPGPEPSGLPLPSTLFPSTSPEPSEDPEPNPTRPTDPIGIDNLLGFNDDSPHVDETAPPPAPEPDTAQDDDAAVESLFKDGVGDKEESGSSELGEDDDVTGGAYGVGGGLQPKIMKPVQANANAKAIASHIVDMIMRRKSTMEDGGDGADANADADAASIGLTEGKSDDMEAKKVSPNLSKEQIAEELADSLTAMTTEAVEANALQSARMADSMNGSPSAKIMADALVEHDKKMAKRIAQILKSDDPEAKLTNGVGDDTAAMGAGVGTAGAQRGRSGEAAQLIMYEEQRRQRDEIEAMRRDLASLMANIQANYAMGVTQGRIDKTASQAASHIIDTLRPVLNKDAVAREGSSETDSLKVFDYPILASSTLSSDGLRLDAGEHESDDADDVDAESSYDDVADKKAKKKGAGAKQAGDDDDFLGSILGSSGDSKSSLSHKASGASGTKTASTAAASDDDGLSLPTFSSSSDDQPGWLAHAPTDEQLTAQFLADDDDDDDSSKKKSRKHESKKSKRRAATLGAVERPREGEYIRALNERAERALG